MNTDRGLAALAVVLLPCVAMAMEDSVTRFRLVGESTNQATCRPLDAVLARPHAVTVVADLGTIPRTLTVVDRQLGCRWQANPEK